MGLTPARLRRASWDATGLLLLVLFVVGACHAFNEGRSWPGIDFYQFWAVARTIAAGEAGDVYTPEGRARIGGRFLEEARRDPVRERQLDAAEQREILETYSTPFLYGSFLPFASKHFDRAALAFTLLSIACVSLATALFGLALGFPVWAWLAGASLFLLGFDPVRADLSVGNVNSIQLLLLALFAVLRRLRAGPRREILSGFVLGIALAFKPNLLYVPLLLGVSWIVDRKFSRLAAAAAGMGAGAAAAIVSSSIAFRSAGVWLDWYRAMISLPPEIIDVEAGNFSLSRLLADRIGLPVGPYLAFGLVIAVAAILVRSRTPPAPAGTTAVERDSSEARPEIILVALGCLIYLLTAPLVWVHYETLAIPAALIALQLRPDDARRRFGRAGGIVAVVAVLLLAKLPVQTFTGYLPTVLTATGATGVAVLTALLLAALSDARSAGSYVNPKTRARTPDRSGLR